MNGILTWTKRCFIGFLLLFLAGVYVNAQTPNGKKITFITNPTMLDWPPDGLTTQRDSLFKPALEAEGYDVTVMYVTDAGFDYADLDNANLVIIGHATSSGDFTNHPDDWATVKAPVLSLSNYIMRSSRLKMVNTTSVATYLDTLSNGDNGSPLMVKALDLTDPMFQGLTIDGADSLIDFVDQEQFELLVQSVTAFEAENSGKVLASVADDEVNAAGNIFAVRWDAGVETYSGGVTPQGMRSFFGVGTGHDQYFTAFSDNGFQMFLNEVDYLSHQYGKTWVGDIVVSGASDATSVDVASTLQMGAAVLPADADDMTVSWSVSDAGIASIDANGLLTGVSAGVVTVTATANDGSGVIGTVDVTVETVAKPPNGKKIIFITNPTMLDWPPDGLTTQRDSLFKPALEAEGYDVTVMYVTDAGFDYADLDYADLVIIGHATSSGDFTNHPDDWAAVKAPVLSLSNYIMRSSRLKMVNTTSVATYLDTLSNGDNGSPLMVKALDLTDPMFQGLTIDAADSLIDFVDQEQFELLVQSVTAFEAENSGKVLASVADDEVNGAGNIFAVRWDAGVETYSGGVTPQGIRSFFGVGTGHDQYFTAFSDNGFQMFLNEVDYLASQYDPLQRPKISYICYGETSDDSLSIDALRKEDYDVSVSDFGDGKSFDFAGLNNSDLVIIGRANWSGAFTDVTAWSNVETPVLSMSLYVMRSGKINMINSTGVINVDTLGPLSIKIHDFDDPMFEGLTIPSDSLVDVLNDSHCLIDYDASLFGSLDNVKLLSAVSLESPGAGDGAVFSCRWDAGVETYPGSGMIPTNIWSYFGIGADFAKDSDGNTIVNYFSFTDNGLQMWLNEIDYLINYVAPEPVLVSDITVTSAGDATTVDLDASATLQMAATVLPVDADDMTVTWSVSDAGIATIDASGLLTPVAKGVVIVTATANDASGISGTMDITVTSTVAVDPESVNNIKLYYNSRDDLVQIRNSSEVERVAIYSITGQELYNQASHNQESLQINASMLHNGVFIVKMQLSDNRTHSVKFVK